MAMRRWLWDLAVKKYVPGPIVITTTFAGYLIAGLSMLSLEP